MGAVLANLTWKSIAATEVGEIFRTKLKDKMAICVTLERRDDGRMLVGILKAGFFDRPTFYMTNGSPACVSFGTHWLIEPHIGPESYPANSVADRNGVLFLHEDKALLQFSSTEHYDPFNADLMTGGDHHIQENAIPVRRWKIWASADDRNRPGAEPVLSFGD